MLTHSGQKQYTFHNVIKHLNVNSNYMNILCDYILQLVNIAQLPQHQILVTKAGLSCKALHGFNQQTCQGRIFYACSFKYTTNLQHLCNLTPHKSGGRPDFRSIWYANSERIDVSDLLTSLIRATRICALFPHNPNKSRCGIATSKYCTIASALDACN